MADPSPPPPGASPRPPRHRRKDARPAEIIEAGLAEFAERGFAAARLEDVARRAGVVKGTIYRYFETKEALFEAAVKARVRPIVADVESLVAVFPGPTLDLLRMAFSQVYAQLFQPDVQALMWIIISEGRRFPDIARFYHQEVIARGQRVVTAIVARGVARGEFRPGPAADLPLIVVAPAITAVIWRMTFQPFAPLDIDKWAAAHADLAFNGLLARDPR